MSEYITDDTGTCSTCGQPIEHLKGEPESKWWHSWELAKAREQEKAR